VLAINEANLPTLPKEQLRTVIADVAASVPAQERVLALDRVLTAIDKSQIVPKNVEGVKADPPPIFFSDRPAILCFQGVWFASKAPTGPWTVADSIPTSIYEIPVSSPAYNVTYVAVQESNDEWVTFVAVAAFTGVMVAWGSTGVQRGDDWARTSRVTTNNVTGNTTRVTQGSGGGGRRR
jgi:hypothetical protein